jgi:hypothetical protein
MKIKSLSAHCWFGRFLMEYSILFVLLINKNVSVVMEKNPGIWVSCNDSNCKGKEYD